MLVVSLKFSYLLLFIYSQNKDDLSQLHIIVKMLCINGTVSHVQHFTKFLNDHNSGFLYTCKWMLLVHMYYSTGSWAKY